MARASGPGRALQWLTGILDGAGIPWQVVGGLAARAYGATRPLHDIDLYVPDGRFGEAVALMGARVVRGPAHHRDLHWDLEFAVLEVEGVRVEVASSAARYYDGGRRGWVPAAIDFDASERRMVEGVRVPVMARERLVDYKRRLGREVDLADLAEIDSAER